MYFRYEGCSILFCTERVVHVSIDCYDPARSWHLDLEVCIVWYRIESSECGSSEQCVVATAERDDVEDLLFASEVVRRSEDHFQCYGARTAGLYSRNYTFKGGFSGLDP